MDIRYYIFPKISFGKSEILTNGIDYFSRPIEEPVLELKNQILKELETITAHKNTITKTVSEFNLSVDMMMMNFLRLLNVGIDVKEKRFWENRKRHNFRFSEIDALYSQDETLYQWLKSLETKILFYYELIENTISQSSPTRLHFKDLPECFHFKFDIALQVQRTQFTRAQQPFVKLLLTMEKLLSFALRPYINMASDYRLFNRAEQWKPHEINISACGLSFYDTREYPNMMNVDIKIYLDSFNEIIEFDGKVVRTRFDHKRQMQLTEFDFYFPLPQYQSDLMSYLQVNETQLAMGAWG